MTEYKDNPSERQSVTMDFGTVKVDCKGTWVTLWVGSCAISTSADQAFAYGHALITAACVARGNEGIEAQENGD